MVRGRNMSLTGSIVRLCAQVEEDPNDVMYILYISLL